MNKKIIIINIIKLRLKMRIKLVNQITKWCFQLMRYLFSHFHFILTMFLFPFRFQVDVSAADRLSFLLDGIFVAHLLFHHRYDLSDGSFLEFPLIVLIASGGNLSRPVSATWFHFSATISFSLFILVFF